VGIVYLISQYPAISHTFIRREISQLRLDGIDIATISVRRPSPGERVSDADRAAFESTAYVLPASLLALIGTNLRAFYRHPIRYFSTFRLALHHRVPGLHALLWSLFYFIEGIMVAREIERRQAAHLHNHFANPAATVGLLATHFLRLPWSLTLHGISETDYPAGLLLGEKIAAADFVACVSWFGRAQAMRVTSPDYWHKLLIVRCGLDLASLPVADANKGQRVICVGRLSAEKGQLGLLEAFASVRRTHTNVQLTLVGDGPDYAAIRARCDALGLGDAVHFTGRLDELATLDQIAASDLLIVPSFMEGLPVVLMEAMAIGVPVLASRVAGVPELVTDGIDGLLFQPSDWDDLYSKMALLLADGELRLRLASCARTKVKDMFDITQAVAPLRARFVGEAGAGG
jgi:colanic acid/amylovoran biosynthesis glycosyltransferase